MKSFRAAIFRGTAICSQHTANHIARNKIRRGKSMALSVKIYRSLRWLALGLFGLVLLDGYRWWQAERLNDAI